MIAKFRSDNCRESDKFNPQNHLKVISIEIIATPLIEIAFLIVHVHRILANYIRTELSKSCITSHLYIRSVISGNVPHHFAFLQSAHVGQLSDIVCTVRTA